MNDNNDATDFVGVFETEMGVAPSTDDTTTQAPTPEGGEGNDGESAPPAGTEGEQPVPSSDEPAAPQGADKSDEEQGAEAEAEKPKTETAEEAANREGKEAAEAEAPRPLTADEVKAAMREYSQETNQRVEKLHSTREEVINKLYPEGIDRNIYDTDGKVIKTAQDIVDRGLINERTQEPYTYEEAASFILEANRKMDENISELQSWAETVAEQNISLVESNDRVLSEWGDILKAMPKLADELASEYISTQLEFDKTGSYITKMNMSPEAYYGRVLAPYRQLGEALAQKQEVEARQQAEAQQAEQAERSGLPPQRGQSNVRANTGDPMLDALVDELNKG